MNIRNNYKTLTNRERVELQRRQDKERLLAQKLKHNLVYQPAKQLAAQPKVQQLGFDFG
ncbi:MAG: hypothetical protein H6658_12295 [Ardenticatenaceae bacterium]|nr:hypothetical protein [Ardenticatenaceae bacterium]